MWCWTWCHFCRRSKVPFFVSFFCSCLVVEVLFNLILQTDLLFFLLLLDRSHAQITLILERPELEHMFEWWKRVPSIRKSFPSWVQPSWSTWHLNGKESYFSSCNWYRLVCYLRLKTISTFQFLSFVRICHIVYLKFHRILSRHQLIEFEVRC